MSMQQQRAGNSQELASAIRGGRLGLMGVGLFSGVVNLLALTGSLYMLQIYDRVIPSRSIPTLVGLTVLMLGLYAANGILDFLRTRIMNRVGLRFDRALRQRVYAAIVQPLHVVPQNGDGLQPARDLDTIRTFLSGPGAIALFDMPWMPIYLTLVYILHPWLGLLATAGGVLLVALALITEARGRAPSRAAVESAAAREQFGQASRRNADVIRAMGMQSRFAALWTALNARHLTDNAGASDTASGLGATSKVLRLALQSGLLGLGAYLVIAGEASAGIMIAASIIAARALAPVEIAIGNWKGFLAARLAFARLKQLLNALPAERQPMILPPALRSLTVQGLSIAARGATKPILGGLSFSLEAGAGLGVIGPSGSGKSTLARALVGASAPLSQHGTIRLDGAALDQFSPEALGRQIGYLSQDIALFDGTVAENIARFDPDAVSEAIIAAARLAGIHDTILQLPAGYNTRIGEGGANLSGGQRQRVALARALVKRPRGFLSRSASAGPGSRGRPSSDFETS